MRHLGLTVLSFVLATAAFAQREPAFTVDLGEALYGVDWSPDSKTLAVGGQKGVFLIDALSHRQKGVLGGHSGAVWGLSYAADGTLASGSKGGEIYLWHNHKRVMELEQGGWIFALSWSPDGRHLAAADYAKQVNVWSRSGVLEQKIALAGDGLGISWSPTENSFAVGTGQQDSATYLFPFLSQTPRWRVEDVPPTYEPPRGYGRDEVNGVQFSPDGTWLAASHQDGRVTVRDGATGKRLIALSGHSPGYGGARRSAWSPDIQKLASMGEDGRLLVWDLERRELSVPEAETWVEATGALWGVAFSPDGSSLAAAGDDGALRVWSVR